MSTHELLEMASLDALGLLDADEREAFEAAFRAAAPAVQAQIRREQTRFAQIDSTLPRVEAPLGLRARVLAAVREAMHAVTGRAVAGRILPGLRPVIGVNRFWRVGAIAAAAASIVFAFTALQMYSRNNEIASAMNANAVNDEFLKVFGARFESAVFDHNTKFVKFAPSSPADSFRGKALLLVDPSKRRGQFFCKDLPVADGDYELVVVDAQGNETVAVLQFRASGPGVDQHDLKELDLEGAKSLAIRRVGPGGSRALLMLSTNL